MKNILIFTLALLFVAISSLAQTTRLVPGSYATIQAAINAASPGDIIQLSASTFVEPSLISVNKANLTIQGMGTSSTLIQVSGTGYRFDVSSSGVTIKDLSIQKTDKTGEQNIIWIHANDFTLKNTVMSGQFVIGEGEVSRAMVVSGGLTGLLIDGNTFYALRQPAYVSGPTTGIVSNNNTYGTKGWVLENGNLTFTNNTWGVNVFDIAIIPAMPAIYYTDIVAMSAANHDAVIEDQRVIPAVLSVVHVDGNTSYSGDMGGKYHPYSTITPAISRVVSGGKIKVAAGTYNEYITVNKSCRLYGSNAGIHPAVGTHPTEVVGVRNPETILFNLTPAADNIQIDGFKFLKVGTQIIMTYSNANNFALKNCIVESTTNGPTTGIIQFGGGSHTGCLFEYNLFNDLGDHTFYAGGGPYDNLKFQYNKFQSEGEAIFWAAGALTGGIIDHNEFDGVNGTKYNTMNIGQAGNLQITNNWFHGIVYTAIQCGIIDGSISGNKFETHFGLSTLNAAAIQLWGGEWGTAVSSNVAISNNEIHYNQNGISPVYGIRLRGPNSATDPKINGSTIHVHNNSFFNGGVIADAKAILFQGDQTTSVDAICNWWASEAAQTVYQLPAFDGPVSYIPYSISTGGPCFGGYAITTIEAPIVSLCGVIDVPVTVKDFKNIGAISLVMNFDPLLFTYQGVTLHTAISTAELDGTTNPGKFSLGAFPTPAINLPDNAVLFTLHFNLLPAMSGGTTNFTWSTISGQCEYAGPGGTPIYISNFINKAWTIPVRPVVNTTTHLEYCKIQDAINAVQTVNGHTITVAAGTYAEDIIVNKSLTILGPNADNSGCGTRVAEAIIVPMTNAPSSGEIIHVAASNVTIKGFTIDGDNPSLPANGYGFGGADMHAAEGVTVYETGVNNLTVTNNILKNLSYFGVTLYDYPAGVPSSGHVISNNKFQDLGTYDAGSGGAFWGGGVLIYNNQYTAITNNCMTNVRLGIQTGNFSQANPGLPASQVISGNTIQARRTGIFHNLHYGPASTYTLSGNSIVALDNPNETKWDGIFLSSLSVPSISSNNTINGNGSTRTNPTRGYEIWNVKSTSPASISGDASHPVTGVDIGVFANNFEGYSSDGGDGAHATVTGLFITPKATGTGVRLLDSPSSTTHGKVNLSVTGCTITGALEGVKFEETLAGTVGGAVTGNTISASAIGINVTGMVTSATNALSITANNIALTSQLAGSNPTVGILLTNITGTQAALISNNSITGPFYGYMIYNLNTSTVTTITGGNITGIMQGIAALNINPATGISFAPSTFNLDGQIISGFIGTSANPNINFHAGVYIFTGGSGTADVIKANVNNVSVTGTGNIQQDCAGLSFADFSTGTGNRQNITVTECTLTDNLNRGINIRGLNALVEVATSTLTGNGKEPYGLGGNDGFGIIVRQGATANVHNNFITNPASITGGYQVSALFTDMGTGPSATLNAHQNSLSQGGNLTSKLAGNGSGTLDATCNWLGSTVPAANAAVVSGMVTYNPWLCSGIDQNVAAGFQGVPCNSNAPAVPANGFSSVECLLSAVPPTTPIVLDVDGITILTPTLVSMVDSPDPIVCEGNRTYTYSFTNCSGITANWSYVYTIDHTTAPVLPANGGSPVQCLASVTTPTPPSGIIDVCGASVTAVPVPYVDVPASLTCEGTRTYSWTYTDCSGLVSTWNYVYTIEHTSLPTEIGGPVAIASTVECEASAGAPSTLPVVEDICGNALTPGAPTKQLSFTNKFDAPLTLGATAAPGVWYTDRYAPSGFATASFDGGNRLRHSISASDGANSRPSAYSSAFYNTQGRSFDFGTATDAVEVKLFIPSNWATSGKRMAGLWGVAVNASSEVKGYPIVEFTSDGGNARFRAYDNGTYVNMGLPAGFVYNSWVTLKIKKLPNGEFQLSVGELNYVTKNLAVYANVRLKSAILQGHNYDPTLGSIDNGPGVTYDIYWDNFTYNDTYAAGTCEGAISYTYDYADCSGLPYSWVYTYTIDHVTAPVVPADGAQTVECLTSITTPTPPTVVDVCGLNVPAVLVSTVDSPDPIVCEGTRAYNYTYTDCSGLVSNWKYIYTIDRITNPSEFGTPVSQSGGTVECVASAFAPTTLPVVKDVCGNILSPTVTSPVIGGTYTNCEGTYTYTYNYKDCANLPFSWTYTYTINHTTPPVVPANGVKTVSCPSNAVDPTLVPTIVDQQQLLTYSNGNWTDFTSIGQSFTCGTSGWMTQLDLKVGTIVAAQNFTLQIYQGNDISSGTLLYSGSHSLSAVVGWQSLNIQQNLAPYLTAGTQYTFWLTAFTYNQLGLICMNPDVYSGGVAMDGCTTGCSPTYAYQQWSDFDLVFKTYMTTVPIVTDVCGNNITPVLTSTVDNPSPLVCEGTRTYTYKYEDCSGLSTNWSYVYTIDYLGGLTPPSNGSSTVSGPAQAVNPGAPATITDACGRSVVPSLVGSSTPPACDGTVVWTYRYTACDGTTTADWTFTYTITKSTISGTVSYYNTANTPLNALTVELKQGTTVIGTGTTNSSGGYAISGICPGTYDVVISSSVTPVGGINATDAALVNSWFVNSYSIEKVRFYAGDAIMSNYLHPSDATRILKHFTSNMAWSNRGDWSFWPVGEMIDANPASPPVSIAIPQIVVTGSMTQNFYGLITGDFNSSYAPGAKSSLQSLTLNYDQVKEVELGKEYELPVYAGTTMEVGAVSLIMNFPADKLEVLGVYFGDNVNNPVEYAVNGNEIRIGWQSLDPVSLKVDEQLLTLKVRAIGSLDKDETIRFSLKADPLNELADGSYNTINSAILKMAEMGTKALGTGEISLQSGLTLVNYPNPFIGTTTFAYTLPYDGKVTLEINNALGSKVKILVDEVQTAGDHTLTVNANELKPGVYTATLRLIASDAMLNRTIKVVCNQ
jgi:hypothetical protein